MKGRDFCNISNLFVCALRVFFSPSNSNVPMPYLGSTPKIFFEPNLMLKTQTLLGQKTNQETPPNNKTYLVLKFSSACTKMNSNLYTH
jgi:hypothetical protein